VSTVLCAVHLLDVSFAVTPGAILKKDTSKNRNEGASDNYEDLLTEKTCSPTTTLKRLGLKSTKSGNLLAYGNGTDQIPVSSTCDSVGSAILADLAVRARRLSRYDAVYRLDLWQKTPSADWVGITLLEGVMNVMKADAEEFVISLESKRQQQNVQNQKEVKEQAEVRQNVNDISQIVAKHRGDQNDIKEAGESGNKRSEDTASNESSQESEDSVESPKSVADEISTEKTGRMEIFSDGKRDGQQRPYSTRSPVLLGCPQVSTNDIAHCDASTNAETDTTILTKSPVSGAKLKPLSQAILEDMIKALETLQNDLHLTTNTLSRVMKKHYNRETEVPKNIGKLFDTYGKTVETFLKAVETNYHTKTESWLPTENVLARAIPNIRQTPSHPKASERGFEKKQKRTNPDECDNAKAQDSSARHEKPSLATMLLTFSRNLWLECSAH